MNNPQIDVHGTKFWRNEKGQLHREDGPAAEYANGNKSWYKNGKLHREDGPAFEYANGGKHWYQNGKLHREDGPAFEHINGYKEWYIEGKCYSKESEWKEALEVYCLNKGIKSIFTIKKETEEEKQKEQLRIIEFPKEYETIEL